MTKVPVSNIPKVRTYGFGPNLTAPLHLFTKDTDIKSHHAYTAAKSGDVTAAIQLILDLALGFIEEHSHQFSKDQIFVSPHAREASGDNAIPQVLVDDVTSLGGTLAELANYIQSNDSLVENAVVLVNAGRSTQFKPQAKTIQLLTRRFGHEITEIFGITPAALTANEATYLVGFRTADEIRNRLAKARQETHLRLRSKGLGLTP